MVLQPHDNRVSQIAQAVQSLQSAAAAGERVFEFLEAEEMEAEDGKLETLEHARGSVEFSHNWFGYEDSDRTIFPPRHSRDKKLQL